MQCPVCQVELKMTDRQGVEVDYCPRCRGVWLDRGELDKIIERAAVEASPVQGPDPRRFDREAYHDRDDHDRDDYYEHERGHYPHRRKRKSFLSDIFDFD